VCCYDKILVNVAAYVIPGHVCVCGVWVCVGVGGGVCGVGVCVWCVRGVCVCGCV